MLEVLLALAFAVSPLDLHGAQTQLDLEAIRRGVETRLGPRAEDWHIGLERDGPSRLRVTLSPPSGSTFIRSIELAGDDDARARQVAAELALLIDQHAVAPAAASVSRGAPRLDAPRAFIAAGFGLGGNFASEVALDTRLGVAGGGYVAGQHLVPWASVEWSRSSEAPLSVDALRANVGLAAGSPAIRDLLWFGGLVRGGVVIAYARERGRDRATAATIAAAAAVHIRWRRLWGALEFGPELTLPPLRFVGSEATFRWDPVRFAVNLRLGFLFRR